MLLSTGLERWHSRLLRILPLDGSTSQRLIVYAVPQCSPVGGLLGIM